MDGVAELFESAGGGHGCMEYLEFLVIYCTSGRRQEMLAGKGGWRKGLFGPFGVYGRCVDRVLKDFFVL